MPAPEPAEYAAHPGFGILLSHLAFRDDDELLASNRAHRLDAARRFLCPAAMYAYRRHHDLFEAIYSLRPLIPPASGLLLFALAESVRSPFHAEPTPDCRIGCAA